MPVTTITPQELEARRQQQPELDLVDVRTPLEFREVHADLARNVPLDQFDPAAVIAQRHAAGDQPLYVICRTGQRGHKACQKLQDAGYSNVINIEGGTLAWEQLGLPVVRGPRAMSLERQVRIAAGSLVLLSVALSLLVHPACIGLAAFVGAGLVFAGITDTCGMGLLLARMPWNQVPKTASKQAACALH